MIPSIVGEKILVVDDERKVVGLLREALTLAGFEVREAFDGRTGIEAAQRRKPDLIILDIRLPDLSGVEICRRLRADEETRAIPILMLTGSGEEADKVAAFERGADDYVTKPFSPRELVLRVRAILRRRGDDPGEVESSVKVGPFEIDLRGYRVSVQGRPVELTATEFRLLAHLVKHRGQLQTRDVLLDKVWGIDAEVVTRTVDTHVNRLREKLGEGGEYIETVRGVGYRFAARG
ncbi:MAG: response regulator transcription factor [Nitrospirae bacterium]|nr:response regulator transcription factor [Nitrospirota bacterium]